LRVYVSRLRRALGLWRGPALSGVAGLPFARADAARLEEARLSAVEDWVVVSEADDGDFGACA
jgi:hypothetical protein